MIVLAVESSSLNFHFYVGMKPPNSRSRFKLFGCFVKMSVKKRLVAAALPLAFVLSTSAAFAQEAINTPIFSLPVTNFRDIAGVAQQFGGSGYAYTTANDGTMRTGVFYRSNALGNMSAADQATINKLGIVEDIDLRTPTEVAADQDIVPVGATYENINVIGTSAVNFVPSSAAAVVQFMQQTNANFVSVDHERTAIAQVLLDMAHANGAVLFHCTAGKDRTGWVTAVLDNIAGMSSSDIMANYLATNQYSATLIASEMTAYTAKYGAQFANAMAPALGVQASFLQAGLDQVASEYGTMQTYLTQGLGLTQADIYVLRAKMVDFGALPGEANMSGNAASGAAFLRSLQNSPLSGTYTAFNYYLQSAIDAGTLNGEQSVVGGQIYADTASALTRAALASNQMIEAHTTGVDLTPGTGNVWMTTSGNYAQNNGDDGNANDVERMAGGMLGVTYRANTKVALNAGLGYGVGSLSSAGASNLLNTYSLTVGGRYALTSLQQGVYTAVQADYEYAAERVHRSLGNGLGAALGHTHANVYGGQLSVGDRFKAGTVIVSPEAGFYASYVDTDGLTETNSELALTQARLQHTFTALTFAVPVQLPQTQYKNWQLSPSLGVSYDRVLGSPEVRSTGTLYGYNVSQNAAFHSANLFGAHVGLEAATGRWSLKANAGSQFTAEGGTGFDGHLALGYKF